MLNFRKMDTHLVTPIYIALFFLNKIDKMAVLGLPISRILHENNFWTKKSPFFEGFLNG